ncbi:MAG: glycosyltransferase family 39 protein [Candidatus Omnitrophica bacterium]|nr:glycosyltransferase family 39 protein [Candidatus Omnitrophota bacterium]
MNARGFLSKFDRREVVTLLLFVSVYLVLELSQIKLPGLYCDEAHDAVGTLQIMKHVSSGYLQSIQFFGRYFPLVRGTYHGAVGSYFILPFFLLFGVNIVSLRLMPIFIGILTLVFTYLFSKRFFSQKVAYLTILLLVISPNFILGTKLGNDNGSIMQMMSMASLFCLLMWYRKKKNILFYTGMFFLGLGIATRIWFFWFIVALFLASLIYIKDINEMIRKNKLNYFNLFLAGIFAFCLGAFLIICFNFKHNFITLRYILSHAGQSVEGVSNLDYFNNLLIRIQDLVVLLKEQWFAWVIVGSKGNELRYISRNDLCLWAFNLCLIWLVFSILFIRKKRDIKQRKILFLLLLVSFIFLQSPITLRAFGGSHLFILFPLLQLVIGLALVDMVNFFKGSKLLVAVISSILLVLIITDLNVIIKEYSRHKETGGGPSYSDSINQLARWLKEKEIAVPLAMDWGLCHNLIVLTDGKVRPRTFRYIEESGIIEPELTLVRNEFIKDLKKEIEDRDRLFLIFRAPEISNRDRHDDVLKITKETNRDYIEEKRFYSRNGQLIYLVNSINLLTDK